MSKSTAKKTETVTIECPRCGGSGRRPMAWKPDAGICYRCKGRCTVEIDIHRHQAALRHLRAKYAELRAALRNPKEGDDTEWIAENLNKVTASGQRVRADLEAAGVAVD